MNTPPTPGVVRGVVGDYLQPLLHTYLQQAGSLSVLATHSQHTEAWLYQPPPVVSADQYLTLISIVESLTQDTYLGLHMGANMQLQHFAFLGYALANATTLGMGLEQVLAFESEVHNLGLSEVRHEDGNIRFVWHSHFQAHPASRHLTESVLGGLVHLAQQLAGKPIPAMALTFVHDAPSPVSAHTYQRFCQGQCTFGQRENSILLADEVLAWPIPAAARKALSSIRPVIDNQLDALAPIKTRELLQRPQHNFLEQLQQQLHIAFVKGTPTLSHVARSFGITPRTLQRRLAAHGTGFQSTLDTTRQQLAQDYLQYSTLSILDISLQLGFNEQSSFHHFFKSRTGITPRQYRRLRMQVT